MRKWIYALVVAAAGLSAPEIRAEGGPFHQRACNAPYCNHSPGPLGKLLGKKGQVLPVFQAAPWYLYWPYDAHFLTPAPIQGAFYAPPIQGNFPVQPYFPATSGGAFFPPPVAGPTAP